MSGFELNIDVFDPSSVDSALRRLEGYMDWLDGYADNVALQTCNAITICARGHAHQASGRMRSSIRTEHLSDGLYETVADPVDPETGEHYAYFEHSGGNRGYDACDEQADTIGGPDFGNDAINDVVPLIGGIAMGAYTW